MARGFKYDIFLSHSKDDKPSVRRLALRLTAAGAKVWLDEWNVAAGENIPLAIEKGLESARTLVLCLSPAALQSDWTTLERSAAMFRDPSNARRRFIPLLLADCQIPDTIRPYKYVDYRGETSAAFSELLAACRVSGSPSSESQQQDSEDFASSIRSHMDALHRHVERLTKDQYRVIVQLRGQRRVRISGCAGSGKTLVATEKAIRLSQAGVSTLFICHNPLLAEHVMRMSQGTGVRVEFFGKWVAALAGEPLEGPPSLWTNYDEPGPESIEKAYAAITQTATRYEAVIVDEGQDFRQDWWALVEASLADPGIGILYIFHDDQQALLPYRTTYPFAGPILDLSRNCRNGGRVYDLMRRLNPLAPAPEEDLSPLGAVIVQPYKRGTEATVVDRAVRRILATAANQSFVVLLGGAISFEESPFAGRTIALSPGRLWQDAVIEAFHHATRSRQKTGVVCPRGGWSEIRTRLKRLSAEPYPTPQDIVLVREIARSFRVFGETRRRILDHPHFRNAMRWTQNKDRLKLTRPFKEPVWTAEIVMHFEREDWHDGIPQPKLIEFREHNRAELGNAVPVYYVGAFKGLEADVVLMLVAGKAPLPSNEVYVGVSRACLFLTLLIDTDLLRSLPADLTWRTIPMP